MSTSRNINQIYNSHPASSVLTSDLMYLPRSPFGLSNDMGINGQNLASALPKIAQGATDGSNAGSGIIGEYIESYIDTPFSITSGVNTDVTSIALTPGDWLLNGSPRSEKHQNNRADPVRIAQVINSEIRKGKGKGTTPNQQDALHQK